MGRSPGSCVLTTQNPEPPAETVLGIVGARVRFGGPGNFWAVLGFFSPPPPEVCHARWRSFQA